MGSRRSPRGRTWWFPNGQVESTSRMFRCGRSPRYWNPCSRMSVSVWYSAIA